MAKDFEVITYNPTQCKKELRAFGKLLKTNPELSERGDISPFFKTSKQLSAFIGTYAPDIGPASELTYEFSFLGDFAADLVVGSRNKKRYLVVEFEDGGKNSIFKEVKGRATTDWSSRFEHGYSQLIDWFCILDDYKKTDKFKNQFGGGYITFSGLLIVGRNSGVSESDRVRLHWRMDKVLVDSHTIKCITYDDLHEQLEARLAFYPAASKVGK